MLVLCGTSDVLTPPKFSEEMADLAPDVNLLLLDGIGHLSSLEAPEAVTEALHELFCRIDDILMLTNCYIHRKNRNKTVCSNRGEWYHRGFVNANLNQ